ncbi:hypothetical protein BJ742DRAFT_809655 [Cladochytrium replicatum]|nr:hypothetical protein BJ742DRAFT_809655 [Cladochytrium replicatum]
MDSPSIHLSGFLLSALQFECISSPHSDADICGLLLGTVTTKKTSQMSDVGPEVTIETMRIAVRSYVATSKRKGPGPWVDKHGKVNASAVDSWAAAAGQGLQVVGFFRFRGNTRLIPSIRERAIYESLQERGVRPPILLVMTCNHVTPATVSFEHGCFVRSAGTWESCPVVVENLVQSVGGWDMQSTLPQSGTMVGKLHQLSRDSVDKHEKVLEEMVEQIKGAVSKLVDSEKRLKEVKLNTNKPSTGLLIDI